METEKICPLRLAAGVVTQGASQGCAELPEGWGDCLGSLCAWYDDTFGSCAILSHADRACH